MIGFIHTVILVVLLQLPVPTFEPVPSPTPYPTADVEIVQATVVVPHSEIYNGLATVEANLNQLPVNIANPGLPILFGTQGAELFGYMKWIFSTATAYAVFGIFGGFVIHAAARLALFLFLIAVALVVFVAIFILRFIIWVVYKIRAIFS